MSSFPESLLAPTPADGHLLASRMAEFALAQRSASRGAMPAHLSTSPVPAVETLTALNFQSVSAANAGWRR